jgi:hypothetical protein
MIPDIPMFWVISTALVLQGVIIIVAFGDQQNPTIRFSIFMSRQKKPISFEMSELKCFMFVLQNSFALVFKEMDHCCVFD